MGKKSGHFQQLIFIAWVACFVIASSTLAAAVPAHLPSDRHSGGASSAAASPPLPQSPARASGVGVYAPQASLGSSPQSLGSSGAPLSFPSNFHLPRVSPGAHHPGSWGGSVTPPGLIYPRSAGLTSSGWGGDGTPDWYLPKFCNGIWPSTLGQGGYAGGSACYGHDEPGLDFYSPIHGSGGNVTWNVTLPTDRSPTQNQSNLYSAVWFGMTLTDPYAWMGVCFLELQFYPDSDWYAPGPTNPSFTVPGLWVGQAVAWQIEAATGSENPCFISPLFAHGNYGPNMFNMTQGDRISITMSGWTSNPKGENISVRDVTNGNYSYVDLYNHTGNYGSYNVPNNNYILGTPNYPLNPSYVANDQENSLAWTPGGELPVSYAFEIGHGGNPTVPNTNPYGGCSPGTPPNNISTPCPSYDPGSWTNNTASPWQWSPPTFFNATSRMTAAQVGFHQDTGGPGFIDNRTGSAVTTACIRNAPSAWCDYPWFSYNCTEHAFNYGATDYGNPINFGQDNEYNLVQVTNSAGLSYYPPNNVSIPSCGGPSYGVTVGGSGGGSVYFLNQSLTSPLLVSGVSPGYYSLHGYALPGKNFVSWSTTGLVAVGNPSDPYTSLLVSGTGTVTANFAASAPTTSVTFMTSPSGGSIALVPGYLFSSALGSDEASGAVLPLNGGTYSVLALPPSGYNFTSWTVSGTSARVEAPTLPYTMLVVIAGGSAVTITANFRSTTVMVSVCVAAYVGSGTVVIPGHSQSGTCNFPNGASGPHYTLPLGGYGITATPTGGWGFAGWGYTSSVVVIDALNPNGHFLAEQYAPGYSIAVVGFFSPAVTFVDAPANGGTISVGPAGSPGIPSVPSGTTFYLSQGTYTLAAAPVGGEAFSSWTTSSGANLWVESASSAVSLLAVNYSGTVTAHFVPAVAHDALWFNDTPAAGGQLIFNYQNYTSGAENASVASGVYTVFVLIAPGYTYSGSTPGGDVTFGGSGTASVSHFSGKGWINSTFTPIRVPVTYVGPRSATIATSTVSSDTSALLPPGSYTLSANLPTNTSFNGWATQGDVHIASLSSASTSVTVWGPGVIWATETSTVFAISSISLSPGNIIPNHSPFRANVSALSGPGPFTYQWTAPSGWCGSLTTAAIVCTPQTAGNITLSVQVHDAFGMILSPPPVKVDVVQPFSVQSLYTSYHNLSLGAQLVISVSWIGGVGPYVVNYTGLPGCTATTGSTETCTPTSAGTFPLNVSGTDGTGQHAWIVRTIVVNPALSVQSLGASPATFTLGTVVVLTATVVQGTRPYTLSYTGLPTGPGCTSANTTSLSCLPTVSGSYNVTVHVADAGGGSATLTTPMLVNVVPAINSLTSTPSTVSTGGTVTLTVGATGGTKPYTYLYTGLPSDCASQNASTLVCASQHAGPYTVTVKVTDADGKFATQTTTFTVQGAGAGAAAGGLSALDWILIAVVAVVVVALVAVLLRRRPPSPDRAQGPPAEVPTGVVQPPPPAWSEGGDSYIYGEESGPR